VSNLRLLLKRNRAFAATGAYAGLAIMPRQQVFLVTCLVPRVEPATDAWPGHWHPLYLLILTGYALAFAVAAARLFRWK
jgi:hypothetical protein